MDPWDAIALYHVFRDPWERRIPLQKPPERDVRSVGDYPELQEMFDQIEEAIRKDDEAIQNDDDVIQKDDDVIQKDEGAIQIGEETVLDLHDSTDLFSVAEQTTMSAKYDRLWIFRHGGHMGEPLGRKRLPWVGPPDGDSIVKKVPRDDGSEDDEHSEFSFVQGYRTPSPLGYGSRCVQRDEEAPAKETPGQPMDDSHKQGFGEAGQNPITNFSSGGNVENDDEQYLSRWRLKPAARVTKIMAGRRVTLPMGDSARPVTSRQSQRLSG